MPRIEAQKMPEYASDGAFKKAVKEYHAYISIRRDLRKVDEISSYVIDLHSKIKSVEVELKQVADSLFLVRASVMQAILLYGRWFKETTGKTKLVPETFFDAGSSEMSVHNSLIDLRDKYVAHSQLDLLGSDRVWVNTDDDGKFISVDSDFLEQLWPQDSTDLDMEKFRTNAHIVHNKIDAEILPKAVNKLTRRCQVLLGKPA